MVKIDHRGTHEVCNNWGLRKLQNGLQFLSQVMNTIIRYVTVVTKEVELNDSKHTL